MANYHFSASIITRGEQRKDGRKRDHGRSIAGTAAYITKQRLYDCHSKTTYDRRSHSGSVPVTGIHLPTEAPREFQDLQTVLNALNLAERRKDSQMARSYIASLPVELTLDQQTQLVEDFVKKSFTDRGQIVIWGIHLNEANTHGRERLPPVEAIVENPHVHFLVPFRAVNRDGFLPTKLESRSTNTRQYLISLRESWADEQNRLFERLGYKCRVSPCSLKRQGIRRRPTIHLGPKTLAKERQGIKTVRGNEYRSIIRLNQRLRNNQQDRSRTLVRDFGRYR